MHEKEWDGARIDDVIVLAIGVGVSGDVSDPCSCSATSYRTLATACRECLRQAQSFFQPHGRRSGPSLVGAGEPRGRRCQLRGFRLCGLSHKTGDAADQAARP
jgi:hypothetical protein